MKILIDASRAVIENAGIARYTRNICANLPTQDNKNQYDFLVTFARIDNEKKQQIKNLSRYGKVIVHKIPGKWKEYLWQKKWAKIFFNHWYKNYDALFAPSFFELPQFIKIPSVLVIHDLTTFRFANQRGQEVSTRLSWVTKSACEKANHIIAISAQTKKDLVTFCQLPANQISVILLAAENKFQNKIILREDFILSVGTLEPRKNIPTLIKAYSLLPEKIQNKFPLKIVGGTGWNESKIFTTIKKLKLTNRIDFLGYVSDNDLIQLYNKASVFVYPSLFEGFGLPILEAMQCGTPVITTKVSSLPEVGGDAVAYLDKPRDGQALSRLIQKVLSSKKLQNQMSRAGLIQARKFSWAKATSQTTKIINQL